MYYTDLLIGFAVIIVVFMVGHLTGWWVTRQQIQVDKADMLERYMSHRERMKVVRAVKKSEKHPDKKKLTDSLDSDYLSIEKNKPEYLGDHDDNVITRHQSANAPPEKKEPSSFASWKDDMENPDLVYWN